MIPGVIAYVLASWCVAHLPFLPSLPAAYIVLPIAVFGVLHHRCVVLSMFCLGGLSAYLYTTELTARVLPQHLESQDLLVQGRVVELPRVQDNIARFRFRLQTPGEGAPRGDVLLSWYHPEVEIIPGQIWQLTVRLNRPTGSVNFSLFDYEAWLFTQRVSARGYVRTSQPQQLLGQAGFSIHRLRYRIRETSRKFIQTNEHLGLFNALAIGDTSDMSADDWSLLGRTGTTHLLVISGLHIGLIAMLAYALLRRLVPGFYTSIGLTILVAATYGLLAGWGLPVQRAFIMLSIVLFAFCCARRVAPGYQFFVALLLVLLADPLATLSNGFWLSFGAVFFLFLGLGGRRQVAKQAPQGVATQSLSGRAVQRMRAVAASIIAYTSTACRAQWVVYVGMASLLAILLHQMPLLSFLVNLLAIPWVGLVLVPSILMSLCLLFIYAPLGEVFLGLPLAALEVLTDLLSYFAQLETVFYFNALSLPFAMLACLGSLLLLLPRGLIPRWLGVITLFILTPDRGQLQDGELALTFLDVGQGLGVIAETKTSVLLYDTGASFGTRFSNAKQVVLPTLRLSGRKRINHFILSHPDNDHAGGMGDVLSGIAVDRIMLNNHTKAAGALVDALPCQDEWQTDAVLFKVFTVGNAVSSNNDLSCLVLIEAAGHRVLLTGDIESRAELALLDLQLSPISVMSSPHHGSDTSSSPAFLNHVQPETVVISTGYRNRFAHPSEKVLARYRHRQLNVFDTAEDGAVRFLFTRQGLEVESARAARPAIWRRE